MFSTNKMLALQVRTKMAFEQMKNSERGQTAVEYAGIAFLVALIALALIGANSEIGDAVKAKIIEAIDKITG
ncbi:hypothetical protein J5X07_01820 [Actinomyces bowdenii]|uniref:Flp family type IVb pilin n=1 Tax=Actinomyces bowdenii TaxID=131109 RepID=A0A3P1VAS5_9ACTO|nr:Flp family type IVb pilin [Actinomyces bowdenii]MBO3723780.1 hypothetical protein [Actinomyces bowdenii]RRD30767.1 hypothetical protein EII10_01225 [Actinomyces bowdenii]